MALEKGDLEVLKKFLEMPLETTDDVFKEFLDLNIKGTVHEKGKGHFHEFLYIPGSRPDRVLLVAHADTYWSWQKVQGEWVRFTGESTSKDIDYQDLDHIVNRRGGLGADDRAGCAILWLLLREEGFGHSILIANGEEHGQRGSNWLFGSFPVLFQELNGHQFILQLDRHGCGSFVHYEKATKGFEDLVKVKTGFKVETGTRSDISVLCDSVCGVNLCIGYHDEHCPGSPNCKATSKEYLVVSEWAETLQVCRKWLHESDLPRFGRKMSFR
jgi:hypothetical protein